MSIETFKRPKGSKSIDITIVVYDSEDDGYLTTHIDGQGWTIDEICDMLDISELTIVSIVKI